MALILSSERTDDGRVTVSFDLGVTTIGIIVMPADVWHREGAAAAVDETVAHMGRRLALLRGDPR